MRCQPPRSPDLNVLDLGYFSSIQALQYRKAAYDTDSLIAVVHEAFEELRWRTLDNCFVTFTESDGSSLALWWRQRLQVSKLVAVNGKMPMSVKVATDAVLEGYSQLFDS
ncbi:hypothetical protein L917_04882 [Phytophthora nicotianae]|uniref:Uncharacterized protein n=2 Tax=Phytophthora nicotianae TaxID=4792 RepID=W2PBG0_PHYN3|nr:hypothetical protein PPTG_24710 [Phytophthora nicotianae INRA-310]ETL97917.1 hypothetical protein L917_04882 [Phytophthora nicotianae]ETM98171.1 hypothetical protein PPTG_24710 [Phytophthora nicotianae INRA-310]